MLLILCALAFTFAQAQYTRTFLRGLKKYQDDYKLNQYIEVSVRYIENKVLEAAKDGKTYYTEPFYGCDMYGDPFVSKHCDVITEEVKLKVQMLFPECDLAYDPRSGRYILSWV